MENRKVPQEDARYKQCTKEMWVTVAFWIVHVSLALGLTLVAGAWRTPGTDVSLIFGLPSWYFYGGVVSSAIMVFLLILVVVYFFEDMSLGADPVSREEREEDR